MLKGFRVASVQCAVSGLHRNERIVSILIDLVIKMMIIRRIFAAVESSFVLNYKLLLLLPVVMTQSAALLRRPDWLLFRSIWSLLTGSFSRASAWNLAPCWRKMSWESHQNEGAHSNIQQAVKQPAERTIVDERLHTQHWSDQRAHVPTRKRKVPFSKMCLQVIYQVTI